MKKIFKILTFIFLSILVIGLCFVLGVFVSVKGYSLDESKLNNKSLKVDYYDKDGDIFYTDYLNDKGDYISIDKLSSDTINAFISIEDKRFFKHNSCVNCHNDKIHKHCNVNSCYCDVFCVEAEKIEL